MNRTITVKGMGKGNVKPDLIVITMNLEMNLLVNMMLRVINMLTNLLNKS